MTQIEAPKVAHFGYEKQIYTCPTCKRPKAQAKGWECAECFEKDLKKDLPKFQQKR
jgi:ribosomal protein L37AE/L43A